MEDCTGNKYGPMLNKEFEHLLVWESVQYPGTGFQQRLMGELRVCTCVPV